MNPTTQKFRESVAEAFIQCLEENPLHWKKSWKAVPDMPYNAVNGNEYKGVNRFFLMAMREIFQLEDPRFATFKQIQDKGWHLKKGSKGFKVEYWYPYDQAAKKPLTWGEYRIMSPEEKQKCSLLPKYFTVFAAKDIEGIPELPPIEKNEVNVDKIIPTISKNMGVPIVNDGGNRAFYRPSEDRIHMPEPEYFNSEYDYNSVAMHELAHATGATHRLNRNINNHFGSDSYAYEELVAEIASVFASGNLSSVCSEYQMDNHKAYVQSWISALKKKPEILMSAIKDAGKAADYLELNAELINTQEYQKRNASVIDFKEENKHQLIVGNDEIIKAGFKPTKPLVSSMNYLNKEAGRRVSLKEINELYRSGAEHSFDKKCINAIVKECQRQELAALKAPVR